MPMDEPRAIIGVTTNSGSTSRDTLGVLVASVRSGSPAEKAGIEEGNRIASINGVSLKLSAGDVGDDDMAGVMSRRLSRELDKLQARRRGGSSHRRERADEIAEGQDGLARRSLPTRACPHVRSDERATLGINLAVTGSNRDSLGVFVMSVVDDGPAAKAGIEEGSRIASINGVDVRGHRSDDDDDYVLRTSHVSRFEREISRAKPGDDVDLRIYSNGQYRNVKVKAVRYGDLPRRRAGVTIMGGDNFMPVMAGMGFGASSARIGDDVRRAVETATAGMGRAFGRFGGRMDW